MTQQQWRPARHIPASGIDGDCERGSRASAALLAALRAVPEFGVAMTRPLGAPAGLVEAADEVPFRLGRHTLRPDGLIRVTGGQRVWTCLVAIETGWASLIRGEIEAYLDIARENGFDSVLTISNQIAVPAGKHPVEVDERKVRRVNLHHRSWSQIFGEAVMQRVDLSATDPDRARILGDLIRHLDSGAGCASIGR